MKDWAKLTAWAIGLTITALIVGTIMTTAGVFGQRVVRPFQEETRRQVYDQSRAYQQGTNLAISRYCAEWRTAEPEHRPALAQIINETAATYDGPISGDVQRCLEEVR